MMGRGFLLALGLLWSGPALACPAYEQAGAAYAADDHAIRIEGLRGAVDAARPDKSCSPDQREQIGRWASLALFKLSATSGEDSALDEAAQYSGQWLVRVRLGDRERERAQEAYGVGKDQAAADHEIRAARFYQAALTDVEHLEKKERMGVLFGDLPPEPEHRREIRAQLEEAQLFGGAFVESCSRCASCPAEISEPEAMGAELSFPIDFTEEGGFSPDGEQTLGALRRCLAKLPREIGEILVIGHVEARADGEAACARSLLRAEAVADHLRGSGLEASVRAVGRGAADPWRSLAQQASAEALARADRRTGLLIAAAGAAKTPADSCAVSAGEAPSTPEVGAQKVGAAPFTKE